MFYSVYMSIFLGENSPWVLQSRSTTALYNWLTTLVKKKILSFSLFITINLRILNQSSTFFEMYSLSNFIQCMNEGCDYFLLNKVIWISLWVVDLKRLTSTRLLNYNVQFISCIWMGMLLLLFESILRMRISMGKYG